MYSANTKIKEKQPHYYFCILLLDKKLTDCMSFTIHIKKILELNTASSGLE